MAVTTEKELSPNARSLWLKATSAIELRNYGYAIALIQAVLKESPAFLTGRQWLRRAEVASVKSNKGFLKGLSGSSIQAMKSHSLVKKDPQAAIIAAEEILEKDPYNMQGNSLLRDGAAAAGMIEVVGFALETMVDANNKDTKVLHELARHYAGSDQPEKAIEVFNRINAINPADLEAIKGGKDAAARASMRKGNWDQVGQEGTSYRDVLKNKDEAQMLEQQNRLIKSEDVIDQLLAEQYALYNENPQNLNVVRRIADLHEKKDDYEGAIQYYQWAVQITEQSDPGLIRKVNDLTMKNFDRQIQSREEWLRLQAEAQNGNGAAPDDETRETILRLQTELEDFKRQKAEMLIQTAQQRVDRNPTDLTFRYELGEQLVKAGKFTEAIAELQKAQNSPNLGLKSKYLLGQCFEAKHILNLAVKQYEDVRGKLPGMDALKKDVVYRLGRTYEQSGDKEKYMACMMEIYEIDSAFQDVAARVEGGYA